MERADQTDVADVAEANMGGQQQQQQPEAVAGAAAALARHSRQQLALPITVSQASGASVGPPPASHVVSNTGEVVLEQQPPMTWGPLEAVGLRDWAGGVQEADTMRVAAAQDASPLRQQAFAAVHRRTAPPLPPTGRGQPTASIVPKQLSELGRKAMQMGSLIPQWKPRFEDFLVSHLKGTGHEAGPSLQQPVRPHATGEQPAGARLAEAPPRHSAPVRPSHEWLRLPTGSDVTTLRSLLVRWPGGAVARGAPAVPVSEVPLYRHVAVVTTQPSATVGQARSPPGSDVTRWPGGPVASRAPVIGAGELVVESTASVRGDQQETAGYVILSGDSDKEAAHDTVESIEAQTAESEADAWRPREARNQQETVKAGAVQRSHRRKQLRPERWTSLARLLGLRLPAGRQDGRSSSGEGGQLQASPSAPPADPRGRQTLEALQSRGYTEIYRSVKTGRKRYKRHVLRKKMRTSLTQLSMVRRETESFAATTTPEDESGGWEIALPEVTVVEPGVTATGGALLEQGTVAAAVGPAPRQEQTGPDISPAQHSTGQPAAGPAQQGPETTDSLSPLATTPHETNERTQLEQQPLQSSDPLPSPCSSEVLEVAFDFTTIGDRERRTPAEAHNAPLPEQGFLDVDALADALGPSDDTGAPDDASDNSMREEVASLPYQEFFDPALLEDALAPSEDSGEPDVASDNRAQLLLSGAQHEPPPEQGFFDPDALADALEPSKDSRRRL